MTLFMTALRPAFWMSLKKSNPRNESGRRTTKYFQWLTKNIGYPKLREHPGAAIATMKMSSDWYDFKTKLDKHYPRCPSSDNLRLVRRFEKGGSGLSGLEFKRPAADAASGGLRWLHA